MDALECIHNLLSAGILSLFCLLCYLVHKCCCDISAGGDFKRKCVCPIHEVTGQITPSNNIIVPRLNDEPIKLPLHQFLSQGGDMVLGELSMPCHKCCESSCNSFSADITTESHTDLEAPSSENLLPNSNIFTNSKYESESYPDSSKFSNGIRRSGDESKINYNSYNSVSNGKHKHERTSSENLLPNSNTYTIDKYESEPFSDSRKFSSGMDKSGDEPEINDSCCNTGTNGKHKYERTSSGNVLPNSNTFTTEKYEYEPFSDSSKFTYNMHRPSDKSEINYNSSNTVSKGKHKHESTPLSSNKFKFFSGNEDSLSMIDYNDYNTFESSNYKNENTSCTSKATSCRSEGLSAKNNCNTSCSQKYESEKTISPNSFSKLFSKEMNTINTSHSSSCMKQISSNTTKKSNVSIKSSQPTPAKHFKNKSAQSKYAKEKSSQTKHNQKKGKSAQTPYKQSKGKSAQTKHHYSNRDEQEQEEHFVRFKIRVKGANSVSNCFDNKHCKITSSGTKIAIAGPSFVRQYLPEEAGYCPGCSYQPAPKSTLSAPNYGQYDRNQRVYPTCQNVGRVHVHSSSCPYNPQYSGHDCCENDSSELTNTKISDNSGFMSNLIRKICHICRDSNSIKIGESEATYAGQLDDTEVVYDDSTRQYEVRPCTADRKEKPGSSCSKKSTPQKPSTRSAGSKKRGTGDEMKMNFCEDLCSLHVAGDNNLLDSNGIHPPVAGGVYQLQEADFRPYSERDTDSCPENNSGWGGSQRSENDDHLTRLRDFSVTRLYEKYSCDNTCSQGSSNLEVFADPVTRLKRKYGTPSTKLDSGCGTLSDICNRSKDQSSDEECHNLKSSRTIRFSNFVQCDYPFNKEPVSCFIVQEADKTSGKKPGLASTSEEDEDVEETPPSTGNKKEEKCSTTKDSCLINEKTKNFFSNLFNLQCFCDDDDDEIFGDIKEYSGKTGGDGQGEDVGVGVDGNCKPVCPVIDENSDECPSSCRNSPTKKTRSEEEEKSAESKDKQKEKSGTEGARKCNAECEGIHTIEGNINQDTEYDLESSNKAGRSGKQMESPVKKQSGRNDETEREEQCPDEQCAAFSIKDIGDRTKNWISSLYSFVCKCDDEDDELFNDLNIRGGPEVLNESGNKGEGAKGNSEEDENCEPVCPGTSEDNNEECPTSCPNSPTKSSRSGSPSGKERRKENDGEDKCDIECSGNSSNRIGGPAGEKVETDQDEGYDPEFDEECDPDCDGGRPGRRGISPADNEKVEKQGRAGDTECDTECEGSPTGSKEKRYRNKVGDVEYDKNSEGKPTSSKENRGEVGDDECYTDCEGSPTNSREKRKRGEVEDDKCYTECEGSPTSSREKRSRGKVEDDEYVPENDESPSNSRGKGQGQSRQRGERKGDDCEPVCPPITNNAEDECIETCENNPDSTKGLEGTPTSSKGMRNQKRAGDDECDTECEGSPTNSREKGKRDKVVDDECDTECDGSPVNSRGKGEKRQPGKRGEKDEDCGISCPAITDSTEDQCTQTCVNNPNTKYDKLEGGPKSKKEQGEQTSRSSIGGNSSLRNQSPPSTREKGRQVSISTGKSESSVRPGTREGSPSSTRREGQKKPDGISDDKHDPNRDKNSSGRNGGPGGKSEKGAQRKQWNVRGDKSEPSVRPEGGSKRKGSTGGDKQDSPNRPGTRSGSPVSQRGPGNQKNQGKITDDECDTKCDKSPSARSARSGSPASTKEGGGKRGNQIGDDKCDPECETSPKKPGSPLSKGKGGEECEPICPSLNTSKTENCTATCPNNPESKNKYSPKSGFPNNGVNRTSLTRTSALGIRGRGSLLDKSRISPTKYTPGASFTTSGVSGRSGSVGRSSFSGRSTPSTLIARTSPLLSNKLKSNSFQSTPARTNSKSYSAATTLPISSPASPGTGGKYPLKISESHIYGKRRPGSCDASCDFSKKTTPSRGTSGRTTPSAKTTSSGKTSPTISRSSSPSKSSSISRFTDLLLNELDDDDDKPDALAHSTSKTNAPSSGRCSTTCTGFDISNSTYSNDGMSHYSYNNKWNVCNCDDVCTKTPASTRPGTRSSVSKRSSKSNGEVPTKRTKFNNFSKDESNRCSICCKYLTESNNTGDPRGRCADCCEAIRERMNRNKTEQQLYLENLPSKSKSANSLNRYESTRVARVRARNNGSSVPETHPISSKIDLISTMKSSIEKMNLDTMDFHPLLTIRIKKGNQGDDEICRCPNEYNLAKQNKVELLPNDLICSCADEYNLPQQNPTKNILAELRADPNTSWPQEFEGTNTQPDVIDRYHITLEETEQICPLLEQSGDMTAQYGKFYPYKKNNANDGEIPESKPCPCGKHYCYPVPPNFDTFVRVYHQVPDDATALMDDSQQPGPSNEKREKPKCSPDCRIYGKPRE